MGSLALRPATLLFGNLRPRVTTTPLPHATGAYGQFPGRDFNPLDTLLLLRTVRLLDLHFRHSRPPPKALCQLLQQRFGILQIGGVEAFIECAVEGHQ
jgi:hypothetical protein